ncbi:MAG: hypothetical protein H6625_05655 [Bdellovibrionaceae bacterium]|nr:hypothetical protein [Pseudobdellovibrionaceae bacterium]
MNVSDQINIEISNFLKKEFSIPPEALAQESDLYGTYIDSFGLLHLADNLKIIAKKHQLEVNIDQILIGDKITLNRILNNFGTK